MQQLLVFFKVQIIHTENWYIFSDKYATFRGKSVFVAFLYKIKIKNILLLSMSALKRRKVVTEGLAAADAQMAAMKVNWIIVSLNVRCYLKQW